MPDDFDVMAAGLRAGTKDHDAHVRAAVELLIEHEHWLWDEGFAAACVRTLGAAAYISWENAGAYLDSGPGCSGGQAAVLRVAIDLGSDRWKITRLDGRNRDRIIRAVTSAVTCA